MRTAFAVLLLAALPSAASAQTLDAAIAGTVRRAADFAPLAAVEVAAFSTTDNTVWRDETDATGAWSIALPAGSYRIRTLNRAGYVDELLPGLPCPHRRCANDGAATVVVASGATAAANDFMLDTGGAIAGTIRRTGGTPIAGAISVYDASGRLVAQATTSSGAYVVGGLPGGAYHVRAASAGLTSALYGGTPCPDRACAPTASPSIAVAGSQTTAAIDVALAGVPAASDETVVYLNPCEGDCIAWSGADDSQADTTSAMRGAQGRVLRAMDLATFAAHIECVRGYYAAYRVRIVADDPGAIPHREQMLSSIASIDFGIGPGYDGAVSDFCQPEIATSLSFAFTAGVHDADDMCLTSAHEFAHQFTLDHTLHGPDVMSHVHDTEQSFTDVTAPCGEQGQARPCRCGGTTTNSHQVLAQLIGLAGTSDQAFADGFE